MCSICQSSGTGVHGHISFSAKAQGTTAYKRPGGNSRGRSKAGKLLFWLASNALPPIPLGTAREIVIGRASDCDIILPEKAISRKHARIILRGGKVVFVDGGSVNGTKINGKKMTGEKVLEKGDQIEVGSYFLDVLGLADTIPFAPNKQGLEGAVRGRIEEMPLTDFLVGIEKTSRTGVLKVVYGDDERGTLAICDGLVLKAKIGKKRERAAALEILKLDEGRYAFSIDEDQRPFDSEPEGLSLADLISEARRSR